MFGIGVPEFIVILVVALIFIGPERLPEVARFLGKLFAEFRKTTEDLTQELNNARFMLEEEIRQAEREASEEQTIIPERQKTGAEGQQLPPGQPTPNAEKQPTDTSRVARVKEPSSGEST